MEGWIQTYTGRALDPLEPDPKEIKIDDIAHALSLVNRFTGHTREPRSVAAHSYDVSVLLERRGHSVETQLIGLLHDASEAYLCDIAAPVKQHEIFKGYREAEKRLEWMIIHALALEPALALADSVAVKQADMDMLIGERHELLGPGPWNPPLAPPDVRVTRGGPDNWEELFLLRYDRLRRRLVSGVPR